MCHRVFFREDIFEKCILCKKENNEIKYINNEYIVLKELRDNLINELNILIKKIDKLNNLEKIEYFYYYMIIQKKRKKRKKRIKE